MSINFGRNKMTHQEILNKTKAEIDSLCAQAKEKLDAIAPKELEVGKWYKHIYDGISFFENESDGYGHDSCCNWYYGKHTSNIDSGLWREATPQEVEKALIEEVKRRYKIGDVIKCFDGVESEVKGNSFVFSNNNLFSNGERVNGEDWFNTSAKVFENGQWATIIEQIKDKPKVGDVVKVWDDDEDVYLIGCITDIDISSSFPFLLYDYDWFQHAKTLTQQEAIDLLFNNK